jgi:hypothetical protein
MRAWILVALLLAGCLGATDKEDDVPPDPVHVIGTPIEVLHDHNDVRLHTGSHGIEFVAWSDLGIMLGDNGFANFVIHETAEEKLAFVAVDGDREGGFVIADIRDPAAIQVLGRYWIQGNGIQEVRVTPDGNFAIMNVQDIPSPTNLLDGDGLKDCSICLHVVDVRDRAAPRLVSVLPVDLLGSHNMHIEPYGADLYLHYVGQPLNNQAPGNYVGIARLVVAPTGAHLVKVAEYRHDASQESQRSFPHDVLVQTHPGTEGKVAYVSHWQGGLDLWDVTDPVRPMRLGSHADPAPSEVLNIHWTMQEPVARADGRVLAWSAPEIGGLESGSGVIRAYDVTDPIMVSQIGTWQLPGGVWIPGQFIFSPHTAIPNVQTGLLAVAHYHAGLWLLDITDPTAPRHVAYYLPHGDPQDPYAGPLWWKKPNFDPEGYGPNVYQAAVMGHRPRHGPLRAALHGRAAGATRLMPAP